MCPLNNCSLLGVFFYILIILVIIEELLQDYFVSFHFQTGIKVDRREFTLGSESIKLNPGRKEKRREVIYFFTGESVFFRVKHIFYNPFFMPFHLKGGAQKIKQGWRVMIRMNCGILLFLFYRDGPYVHPLAGLFGAAGGFFIVKRFGLPHMWRYWEQVPAEAAQQGAKSGLSNE